MEKERLTIKCGECSELIMFSRRSDLGKCLRDSMYKNPSRCECPFGTRKKEFKNL